MAAKWDLAALSVDRHWSSSMGLFDWHAGRGPNATAVSKHAVLIPVRFHLTVASYDGSECPQSGRDLKRGFFSIAAISCLSASDPIADITAQHRMAEALGGNGCHPTTNDLGR